MLEKNHQVIFKVFKVANLKSQIAGIDRAHGESREKVRAYLKAIEKIKASDVWDKMPWWDRAA